MHTGNTIPKFRYLTGSIAKIGRNNLLCATSLPESSHGLLFYFELGNYFIFKIEFLICLLCCFVFKLISLNF